MEINSTDIPGRGTLHVCRTRRGDRLGLLVHRDGRRTVLGYGSVDDPDRGFEVLLDGDEADRFADLLRSRRLAERLAALERAVAKLSGSRV